jgi:hypothetical protein
MIITLCDEYIYIQTYLVIPGLSLVKDDGGAQAPGRVDVGAGDGGCGQVDHEHGEPDWEGRQHLRVRLLVNKT